MDGISTNRSTDGLSEPRDELSGRMSPNALSMELLWGRVAFHKENVASHLRDKINVYTWVHTQQMCSLFECSKDPHSHGLELLIGQCRYAMATEKY